MGTTVRRLPVLICRSERDDEDGEIARGEALFAGEGNRMREG